MLKELGEAPEVISFNHHEDYTFVCLFVSPSMYDQFFCHQIFPITGQETTAAMLSFLLAEVGKHPDVEERLVYLHLLPDTKLDIKHSMNCLIVCNLQLKLQHLHWSLARHVCFGSQCKSRHLYNSWFSGAKLKQVRY